MICTDKLPGDVLQVTTESWKYNGENEVTQKVFDGFDDSGNALACTDTYTYDLTGNRLTLGHDDRTTGDTGSAGADYVLTDTYDATIACWLRPRTQWTSRRTAPRSTATQLAIRSARPCCPFREPRIDEQVV